MRIESPDLQRRARKMAGVDLPAIARASAKKVAPQLRTELRRAARAAGGSAELARAVEVHDGHLNDLVNLERNDPQNVLVGVDGSSPMADEAMALEVGGYDIAGDGGLRQSTAPTFWVRNTVSAVGGQVADAWSAELTRRLERAWS